MRRTVPAALVTPSADPKMNGTAGTVFADRCSPTTFVLPFHDAGNFIIATHRDREMGVQAGRLWCYAIVSTIRNRASPRIIRA